MDLFHQLVIHFVFASDPSFVLTLLLLEIQLWESGTSLFLSGDYGGDVPGWYPSHEKVVR